MKTYTPERLQKIQNLLDKRQNNISILLENISDPHNISAVLRSADAVGISEVYVLNTIEETKEKWGKNSSSGAFKWVMVHEFYSLEECIEAIRKKYKKIYTTHLASNAVSIYEVDLTQSIVLAFGNESDGLSQALLAHSDGNFIIPQMGLIQSLNISVACAVSIYEAMRQKTIAGHYAQRNLNDTEAQNLIDFWNRKIDY